MGGRRLTAILAADIAGYSALMGTNDVETVADLKGHQSAVLPLIAGYNGRVIDTAGDGILAEYASVFNAVKCAVAIQEVMLERNASVAPDRRMQFRIGINQGDVLFDENRIYGDGINIAARLEGICEPGGICISGKVYEEIKGRFEIQYENIGEQSLKNIAAPVQAYRISISGAPPKTNDKGVKPTPWASRKNLVLGGMTLALLLGVGVAWWAFGALGLTERPLPRAASVAPVREALTTMDRSGPEVQGRERSPAAQLGPADVSQFDGVWEITGSGNRFCPVKSNTWRQTVENGMISGSHPEPGLVGADGAFRFTRPGIADPSVVVVFTGRLVEEAGSGSYRVLNGTCGGTLQLHRVARAGEEPPIAAAPQIPTTELAPGPATSTSTSSKIDPPERVVTRLTTAAGSEPSPKLTAAPSGPFDGLWEATTTGGEYCAVKWNKWALTIENNIVVVGKQDRGRVGSDGKVSFKLPSKVGASIVEYTATLKGENGTGSYRADKCIGKLELMRVRL
jgi:class 3 adenylate cyclase